MRAPSSSSASFWTWVEVHRIVPKSEHDACLMIASKMCGKDAWSSAGRVGAGGAGVVIAATQCCVSARDGEGVGRSWVSRVEECHFAQVETLTQLWSMWRRGWMRQPTPCLLCAVPLKDAPNRPPSTTRRVASPERARLKGERPDVAKVEGRRSGGDSERASGWQNTALSARLVGLSDVQADGMLLPLGGVVDRIVVMTDLASAIADVLPACLVNDECCYMVCGGDSRQRSRWRVS